MKTEGSDDILQEYQVLETFTSKSFMHHIPRFRHMWCTAQKISNNQDSHLFVVINAFYLIKLILPARRGKSYKTLMFYTPCSIAFIASIYAPNSNGEGAAVMRVVSYGIFYYFCCYSRMCKLLNSHTLPELSLFINIVLAACEGHRESGCMIPSQPNWQWL